MNKKLQIISFPQFFLFFLYVLHCVEEMAKLVHRVVECGAGGIRILDSAVLIFHFLQLMPESVCN